MGVVKSFTQAHRATHRRDKNPMSFESILNHEPQSSNEVLLVNGDCGASSRSLSPQSLTSAEDSSRNPPKRDPRQKYTAEQLYFLWYHRTDLNEHWNTILVKFEAQFKQERNIGSLECRFYRVLKDWGIKKVREQSRMIGRGDRSGLSKYGVIQQTMARYLWMREEHRVAYPLPEYYNRQAPSMATVCCQQHPYCGC